MKADKDNRVLAWRRRGRAVSAALVLLGLCKPSAGASAVAPIHVQDVQVAARSLGDGIVASEVTIVTSAAPRYSARLADQGRRLLIDISDADFKGANSAVSDPVGLVAGVLTQASQDGVTSVVRVAVTLTEAATYRIRPDSNGLRVSFLPGKSSFPTAEGTSSSAPAAAPSSASARINDIRFRSSRGVDTVTVDLAQKLAYTATTSPRDRSRIEIPGAVLPKELERVLDVSASSNRVHAVSAFRVGDKVVLEAERSADVSATVSRQGNSLVWSFTRPGDAASIDTGVAPDGGAARKAKTLTREGLPDGIPVVQSSFGADPADTKPSRGGLVESKTAPAEAGAFLPAMAAQQQASRYTGRRIDLDLKDADIHNVLRLLADVGRLNIVTADNVAGTVTIRVRNIPWDQAMDVVLQSKGLGMVRQGNLIRVAPLGELDHERELALARRKQELDLAPLETRLIPVSYAQANDVQARAKDMLSARGTIAVDERTNLLIVRDVAGNLGQVEELVRSLDTQTPQVLVEARIVEATARFIHDVGIQWGADATFSASTGNPTGLAFPSGFSVAGGATDGQAPTAGLSPFERSVANPNFVVNLPAAVGTGQGGALGFSFGSINNTVNVALRLSAAETSGMLRIVSSPRVLTMDNKSARIMQGTMLPFAQVSAQGVQTTFQEAKLQLLVTPHVTAEGSVTMHIRVNRDEPDFNQTSPRGDPTILKREAETDLLVMDGHTAVIGGIYTRNTGRSVDQVPFFGDIPLLGLLFQRRRATDTRGELVIFLTPRIVNRAESLGH
jgi:type IV pilus assembly protein PilQ